MSDTCDPVGTLVPDKRYRQLAYQLFGDPETNPEKYYKGPFVNLTIQPAGGRDTRDCDYVLPRVPKRKPRKRTTDRPRKNTTGFLGRCLICYSFISRMDRFKFLGNKLADFDVKKEEKTQDLIEFLRIISAPVKVLHKNLDATRSISAIFEHAINRLKSRPWCVCLVCNSACERLLKTHRAMKKLEQEVNEFNAKFLNAIKLSKMLAEKDPSVNVNDEEDQEDTSNNTDSCAVENRTKISLRMKTVNQVRTCLVGGKRRWSDFQESWMKNIDLSTEIQRNPIASKNEKRRKPGPRSKTKNKTDVGNPCLSVDDTMSFSTTDLSGTTIKSETDDKLSSEVGTNKFEQLDDNFFDDDSIVDPDFLPDDDPMKVTKHNDSCTGPLHKNISNDKEDKNGQLISDQSVDAKKEDIDDDDGESEMSENEDATDEKNLSKKRGKRKSIKGLANPLSALHKPPEKLSMTPGAIRYRELRAKHPNMSYKEMLAHFRKSKKKKGQPGRRLPIEELKDTRPQNLRYIEWRKTHGKTMSDPAYREMRREILRKEQNVMEESGIPGRSPIGQPGMNVNWIEKDGTLSYRGIEVKKHEDGTYSCASCDYSTPNSPNAKDCISYHIKKHHTCLSEAHACEHCDARFYYHNQLLIHMKVKHEGGYQCEICGAKLSNRSALYKHKQVKHQGIKPHVCEHCGKGFASRKDLTIHTRRHTGQRPFLCNVCGDSFIEKQSMKKHIRTKHPGEPQE